MAVNHQVPAVGSAGYGKTIVSWETWEYPKHARGTTWYFVFAIVGVLLLGYALATQNFLFAVILLMIGATLLLSGFREPERIKVYVTTTGVIIGHLYHPFEEIKDFSLVYNPPDVQLLYLDFHNPFHPLGSIPLEDTDPNTVREALLPFAMENLERTNETLTDVFARLYKL